MANSALHVQLLGTPAVTRGGDRVELSPGSILLLSYLLLGEGGTRKRSIAAMHIAGDCSDSTARRRLNTALWRLRSDIESTGTCPPGLIINRGQHEIFVNPACDLFVDVLEFEAAVKPRIRIPAGDLADRDVRALRAGVDLYRGDLLEGTYEEWVLEERSRLSNLYLAALTRLVEWSLLHAALEDVEDYAGRILTREPLREDIHRQLIAAYGTAGLPDLARRQFEICHRVLADELGTSPMAETVALHARVQSGAHRSAGPPLAQLGGIIDELERAKAEIARLEALVDRSLSALKLIG